MHTGFMCKNKTKGLFYIDEHVCYLTCFVNLPSTKPTKLLATIEISVPTNLSSKEDFVFELTTVMNIVWLFNFSSM